MDGEKNDNKMDFRFNRSFFDIGCTYNTCYDEKYRYAELDRVACLGFIRDRDY